MPDKPRAVIGIIWREGNRVEMIYASGDVDRVLASLDIATGIAAEEGLVLVPTSDTTVRWARDPDVLDAEG